jgi:hypothetical protein
MPSGLYANRPTISQTGTSATYAITDANTFQACSNGSTQTFTIPTNASVAFPVDTEIDVIQLGAGQVVFAAAGGVTLNSAFSNKKIASQYTTATLRKTDTDTWVLYGNLGP